MLPDDVPLARLGRLWGATETSIARLVMSWTQQGQSSPRFLLMPIGVPELDRRILRFPDPQPHHAGEKQHPDDDLCDNEPAPPHRENHDGVGAEAENKPATLYCFWFLMVSNR